MGTRVVVIWYDDLTGDEGDDVTTTKFALDDQDYEIDLTSTHQAELREILDKYIAVGRPFSAATSNVRAKSTTRAFTPQDKSAHGGLADDLRLRVRTWWEKTYHAGNPWDLPAFTKYGRIPASIVEAWDEHGHLPHRLTKE